MYNLPDEVSKDAPAPGHAVAQEPDIAAASVAEPITSGKASPDADESPSLDLPAPSVESPSEAASTSASSESDAVASTTEALEGLDVGKTEAKEVSDDSAREGRTLTREEEIEEALNCPCIDAMREGSCGGEFLSAYRCFLESDTEPKGMDCVDKFASMQGCMAEHPEEYGVDEDENGGGEAKTDGVSVDAADTPSESVVEAALEKSPEEAVTSAVEEAASLPVEAPAASAGA